MPIKKLTVEQRNFSKGIITEASPLTFPENASLDEQNFFINRDGSRQRRFGIDFEVDYDNESAGPLSGFPNKAFNTFLWKNVSNNGSFSLLVVQVGALLKFFDATASSVTSSTTYSTINLSTSEVLSDNISGEDNLDFTTLDGDLLVVGRELQRPIKISYTEPDNFPNEFVIEEIQIKVRDIWGVDDGYDVDYRPKKTGLPVDTLSPEHAYNLMNQGWPGDLLTSSSMGAVYRAETLGTTTVKEKWPQYFNTDGTPKVGLDTDYAGAAVIFRSYGTDGNLVINDPPDPSLNFPSGWPSNVDVYSEGLDSFNEFDIRYVSRLYTSTTPAPKGHYVIDFFNRGTERNEELEGLDPYSVDDSGITAQDQEQGTLSCIAGFAGRLFYSGLNSQVVGPDAKTPRVGGAVFFSRIIKGNDDLGKCYQEADPTDPEVNDLLPNDGGFVNITEAVNINKLIPLNKHLLVIAENGVWALSGPDGIFKADSFSVNKISNVGCNNPRSVVFAGDNVFYFSDSGVHALQYDNRSGEISSQNISESTIQTLYSEIPEIARDNAVSTYDKLNRRVRWLYKSTGEYNGSEYKNRFDSELILDLTLGSWYKNYIPEATDENIAGSFCYVGGYAPVESYNTSIYTDTVTDGGEVVTDGGEDVTDSYEVRVNGSSETRFLAFWLDEFGIVRYTVAQYRNTEFLDWYSFNGEGVDAEAFLITGHSIYNDSQRKKYTNYITVHHRRTETGFVDTGGGMLEAVNPSGCLMQPRWDFSNSTRSGKWGTPQQTYRLKRTYIPVDENDSFDYGWEVITTKSKVRGSGIALSLKFSSQPGKDLNLLGWGIEINILEGV